MSAELTRRYNRSADELRAAAEQTVAARFRGREVAEVEGTLVVRTGPHWPLTSLGEQVELSFPRPGVVTLYSSNLPRLPLLFELGDNLANVEGLARLLDIACAALPPCCPQCGSELPPATTEQFPPAAPDARPLCPHCGFKLFDPQRQEPVPDNATQTRWMTCAFILMFVLPVLVMLAAVVMVRMGR